MNSEEGNDESFHASRVDGNSYSGYPFYELSKSRPFEDREGHTKTEASTRNKTATTTANVTGPDLASDRGEFPM